MDKETYFAPARRTDRRKFENQIASISQNPIMDTLLRAAAGLLVILNEDRQIVAVNTSFLEEMSIDNMEQVLGLRLGETLNCVHANEKPNGCGTTEYCQTCGAAIAMMTAILDDKPLEETCALLSDKNGILMDTCLRIKAVPVHADESRWILIYAQDITKEVFWNNLERIFFHDISNTLTSVYGNTQLLDGEQGKSAEVRAVKEGVERLIREIQVQKIFSREKISSRTIPLQKATLKQVQKELHLVIKGHPKSRDKKLKEEWPLENINLDTDVLLVSRILGNMIINAFEASETDQEVFLNVETDNGNVIYKVWNPGYIPEKNQKRIFHKFFSTKPEVGRGLGTYAIKLFGESYLNGKVSFSSSKKKGTCFTFSMPQQNRHGGNKLTN